MRKDWRLWGGVAAFVVGAVVPITAAPMDRSPQGICTVAAAQPLLRRSDPTASVEIAQHHDAGEAPAGPFGGPSRSFPAHCEMLARLEERDGANGQHYAIRFRLRLPDTWNSRFLFQGGGGTDGNVGDTFGALAQNQPGNALSQGYAVVSQDSGHDNAVNKDSARQGVATFGWDAQARHNYGFASLGVVTTAAKVLIAAHYGRAPRYSYFSGGSKGGQEAFMVTQRYPRMFDGVLAGYPGFRLATAGAVAEVWDSQAFADVSRQAGLVDAGGLPLLGKSFSDEDLALVSRTVLMACDALDGTTDGMIENFPACTTEKVLPHLSQTLCDGAKQASCLSPAQIAALVKVVDGARNKEGQQLYAAWPWDAGLGGASARGWRDWKIGHWQAAQNDALNIVLAGGAVSAVFISPPVMVAADPQSLTRFMLGTSVDAASALSKVKWGSFGEAATDFMNADATDLSAFSSHGGRLLVYHGVSDPVFSINDTIAWWQAVDRHEKGQAARFVRLFAVPGMNHGGGGPSTDRFDAFGALVDWVENGRAPESLTASAGPGTPWPGRTRLLCPYPQQPRRTGTDIETAASFHCTNP